MYFRSALFLIAFGLILSCNSNESSSQSKSKMDTAEKVQPKGQTLPSLPLERMKRLWEETTQLDYIFLNLPISMNMDNQEAIRSSLSHFAPDGVTLNTNCKQHDGTMLFAVEGEIIEECQFFYQDGCKYFVWLENGKKTYANAITPSGLEFMEKMFSGAILNNAREPINRN